MSALAGTPDNPAARPGGIQEFAAIDFETANKCISSVCSVGVVIVREGRIVEEYYSLIRPAPEWYSRFNTGIHGLTQRDTASALRFPKVWTALAPKLAGLPLVAHFARFDEGCLRAAHAWYEMPWPDYRFLCTCTASRRVFGKTIPNHRLPTVAAHCGFEMRDHHHALADARACAHIALAILPGQE